jgi:hypothetical protein
MSFEIFVFMFSDFRFPVSHKPHFKQSIAFSIKDSCIVCQLTGSPIDTVAASERIMRENHTQPVTDFWIPRKIRTFPSVLALSSD